MGEPHKFNSWKMFLTNRMRCVELTPIDSIAILSANTGGEPHKVVEQYKLSMGYDPQVTLDRIWAALHRKFGSYIQVCAALSSRIDSFPVIRPPNVTDKLSELVDICRVIELNMEGNPELYIYNLSSGQHKIWSKLPDRLQQKWRTRGHEYSASHRDHIPPFSMLLQFIERESEEMNNPFFQKYVIEDSTSKGKSARVLKAEIHDNTDKYCIFHQRSGHSIYDCRIFTKLSHYDKIKFAKKDNLCFNCLGKHLSSSCNTNIKCNTCKGNHCTVMHKERKFIAREVNHSANNDSETNRNNTSLCISLCGNPNVNKSCSKTLLCDVFHKNDSTNVTRCYVIVDEQSTSSFIDTNLAKSFDLTGPEHEFTITTITGYKTQHKGVAFEGLRIKGVNENKVYDLPTLLTNDFIPDCRNEVAGPDVVKAHPHISHLSRNFAKFDPSAEVLILLGRDSNELMRTKCFGEKYPYAHKTPLGWALVGSTCIPQGKAASNMFDHEHYIVNKCFINKSKVTPVRNCFEEMSDDEEMGPSQEDQRFISMIDKSVYVNNKGFLTMQLPFKDANVNFTDNQKPVYCRTKNTLDRLKGNKPVLQKCIESMGKNIEKGHVEEVPAREKITSPGRGNWLPIFVVIHPRKQKPRLVFDSSAVYNGSSLNDKLLQGPDEGNKLRSVLLRFRMGEVGFSADIESMFYNFYLPPDDKDYLRFHWFRNNNPENELVQYRGCVHLFGNRPSPAIAHYGLTYAVRHNTDTSLAAAGSFISDNFYVDDGLGSARSTQKAIDTLVGARSILSKYHIRLHKIISNDKNVMNAFPDSELAEPITEVSFGDKHLHRTLGLAWNLERDELFIMADIPSKPFTKRGLLSVVGSLYDPLGIVNPVTLRGKVLQRQIMKQSKGDHKNVCEWDEELSTDYFEGWKDWKSSLSSLHELKLPRSYIYNGFHDIERRELHIFSDASEVAIAAVAYLKLISCTGQVNTSYLMSKSKLIPKTATSMPRAELCAAVEAAYLHRELVNELKIEFDESRMYTDSMVVLGYLNNTQKRFTNYVTRRIYTILKLTSSTLWSYIASNLNPADVGSRCHSIESLLASNWLKGPQFLHDDVKTDPLIKFERELPEQKDICSLKVSLDFSSPFCYIFRCTTSLGKAINIAKMVLTFIYKVSDMVRQRRGCALAVRDSVSREIALNTLISTVQAQCYDEFRSAWLCGEDSIKSSKLDPLCPFIDNFNVLRVGGRLKNSSLLESQKYPILLPTNHSLTAMVIRHYHESVCHQGRHLTMGAIRSAGYHIEKGSKVLKSLLASCTTCRKLRGQAPEQLMSDLPTSRLEHSTPFHDTGLDVFGPFVITDGKVTRSTAGSKKIWVLMLTCMVSRAIHVEPLLGLDISSLKNALRRFIAIRGTCKHLYSDCGTNFIGANNLDMRELDKSMGNQDFQWHFNTPHASHHGGTWERKIGSIRRILDATMMNMKQTLLTRDEFTTLLYEAMAIVNNTPLWGVSTDPCDPAPINPAMLLTLKTSPNPPSVQEFSSGDLINYGKLRWKKVQYLADFFWKQWQLYYLSSLQERRKWRYKRRNIKVNDIVLLKEKNLKRNYWPTGIITAVKTSRDDFVRSITVTVSTTLNGKIVKKSFDRPISEIVLLVPSTTSDD